MADTPRKPSDETTEHESTPVTEAQRRAETQRQQADARKAEEQKAEAERAEAHRLEMHRAAEQRKAEDEQRAAQSLPRDPQRSTPPTTQPLRCRCGSTAFAAPQAVALTRDGEQVTATPCPAPDTLTYTCLGCGDTGTLDYLKGRLNVS